jgi:hypothetical protein
MLACHIEIGDINHILLAVSTSNAVLAEMLFSRLVLPELLSESAAVCIRRCEGL